MQDITPYLLYEDVPAALDWLSEAFGFEEVLRFQGEGGVVNHAELRYGGESIYLGNPGEGYRCPKRLGTYTALVHVYVDDVDTHYERAKAAGAEIRMEPTDQPWGDRRYDACDLEGQLWSFATRGRQVPPEEWGATAASS
jgi:uncharacterized glyoxalase superfamily protein PhnB